LGIRSNRRRQNSVNNGRMAHNASVLTTSMSLLMALGLRQHGVNDP
jgi:hypothetical protein